MADKLDKLLTDYFTGRLDILIKQREQELRNPKRPEDLNKDIKAANSYSNAVENILMKLEDDDTLQQLENLRGQIKALVDMFDDQHKQVYFARYRNKLSWKTIEWTYFVDERTGRRWCNELKILLSEYNIIYY
ncbi:hypothetical protein IV73_GL000148 [Weissella kandleri]|uniref:Uncharacterized protein n=1 Tax=Weissella kandleri TaxID=1616 RepID=A0A0R2JE53_9LACO|nr:DUF722 domain-containing protein [Weissella kandleri]KRN75656.1 hypothetical protein IV73_GL000148 [Weissella kandleri]